MSNGEILLETLEGLSGYLKYIKSIGFRGLDLDADTIEIVKDLDNVTFKIECNENQCPDCYIPFDIREGFGNRNADIIFLCDTPDELFKTESETFELFEKMLNAIDLSIDDVYITSLIKCQVPDYILPSQIEYDNCFKRFKEEIEAISPKIISVLGSSATRVILKKDGPVSELRGNFIEFGRTTVFPTFHPSFLLSNPEYKKSAWNDLLKLKEKLNEI